MTDGLLIAGGYGEVGRQGPSRARTTLTPAAIVCFASGRMRTPRAFSQPPRRTVTSGDMPVPQSDDD